MQQAFGPNPPLTLGVGARFAAGLCWVAASLGVNYPFERKSLRLFFINASYHTLQFTPYGLIGPMALNCRRRTMRRLFWTLALLPYTAIAQPESPYQPLEFLAGHCWKGALADGKRTDEHCFSWIYERKFLRDEHTVRGAGHADNLGESIYYWNSSTKQIEYLYIESQGGISRGAVTADKDALVFPATKYVENGQVQIYRSRWQRSGDHAYDVITEFESKHRWVPGFKAHMEEVAEK